MTTLRKNEFMDMLEMKGLIYEDKDKFLHCDIPTLGKVTYYPKADKLQINRTNKWEEGGFEFVKNILAEKTIQIDQAYIDKVTSLVKMKEEKSESELRNEFAGLAMQGICVNANRNSFSYDDADSIADYAFLIADAMVKRSKL